MAAAAKAVAFFAAITSLLLVPASYGRREVAGEGLVFIIHCEDCVGAITAALPCVLAIIVRRLSRATENAVEG